MLSILKNKRHGRIITNRLLGTILTDGGFITVQNLEAALERKKETNEQIGEALVRMGVLNPRDLNIVLSVQRDLSSLEDSVKGAAGIREILGELLLRAKKITAGQLAAALKEKIKSGERLGEVLVRLGSLSETELGAVLTFQQHQSGEGPVLKRFRLGGILVATGQITRQRVKDVIARQKISQKLIGELLVEAGYVKRDQINCGLKLQQRLVTAALVATVSIAGVLGAPEASAGSPSGSSSSVKLTVHANVLERTKMEIINEVHELVVTADDILRGSLSIPAACRINVKSNNPRGYFLMFDVMNDSNHVFNSVSVVIGGRDVQISPGGGWVHQPFIHGGTTTDLSYRFELSKDAKPGTYHWPLMVSVQKK